MNKIQELDYKPPAFEIKIEGKDMEHEMSLHVSAVTVTKRIGQSDHIRFQVQDKMENGTFIWIDKDTFKIGNKINIALGYPGELDHKAEAHIQEVSPRFEESLPPSITVEGTHKVYSLLSRRCDLKTYKKKSDSDIIKAIAGEVGIPAVVDRTAIVFENKFKNSDTDYLRFIRKLVEQNSRFEFFITNGKLYFRRAPIDKSETLTLKWGENLVSFIPMVNVANMITTVIARGIKDKKTIEAKANAGQEKAMGPRHKLGSQIAKKSIGERIEYITDYPAESNEQLKELALARLEAATANFVIAVGRTMGIPSIEPGICIKLEGLGDTFSGKYYVMETVHNISCDGYIVNFVARRNVL
jgi:phage protein D